MWKNLLGIGLMMLLLSCYSVSAETTYDYGRETTCKGGTCNMVLYSGVRFVPEGDEWVPIEKAKRLDDKEVFNVNIESDGVHGLEVVRFDYHCITLRPYADNIFSFEYNKEIPMKINNVEVGSVKIPGILSPSVEIRWCPDGNVFAHNYSFGEKSTTVKLVTNETESLEDTYCYDTDVTPNGASSFLYYGEWASGQAINSWIKYNLSVIPSGQVIDDARLWLWMYWNAWDDGEIGKVYVHGVCNQTWHENLLWSDLPGYCSYELDKNENIPPITSSWLNFSVTDFVSSEYDDNENNVSFLINATLEYDAYDATSSNSKEYSNFSIWHFLNITYSEAPGENPEDCWTEETGKLYIPPGCKYYTNTKESIT